MYALVFSVECFFFSVLLLGRLLVEQLLLAHLSVS